MPEFQRVRDKDTGHEYSVVHVDSDRHEVIDARAVDVNGRALPAKTKDSGAKKASAKAAKGSTTGGEPAANPEEGSK